ncbi:MAG: hypothetical protein Q7N50_03530 [Armatimonadota bacterium]|nr:hypothetical protein [Armatimonadota bacterium]
MQGKRVTVFSIMRFRFLVILFLLLTISMPHIWAISIPSRDSTASLELKATTITIDPGTQDFEAVGNVRATYDTTSLTADKIEGNAETRELFATNAAGRVGALLIRGEEITSKRVLIPGQKEQYRLQYILKNGLATTCDLEHPDYKVTARKIVIIPQDRAIAKKVSLWLGKVRILTVPRFVLGIAPEDETQSFLPKPGYDNRDGAFVGLEYQLIAAPKTRASLDIRATTRSGIQGGVTGDIVLSGDTHWQNVGSHIELRSRPLLLPSIGITSQTGAVFVRNVAPLRQFTAFGSFNRRKRVFDVDRKGLLVDSSPDVGVRYVSNPVFINAGHKLGAYFAGEGSWGYFGENQGNTESRSDMRGSVIGLPVKLGGNTYVQPAVSWRGSWYKNGDSYKALGISADLTRVFGKFYFSTRYIGYSTSGNTPFEFDDIDRTRTLSEALGYYGRRDTYGLVLCYSLDRHDLYDWEFSFSRKLHCLEPTITWRNRFGLFNINVRVLGFD